MPQIPFLEILTRTYKRPRLLAQNQASLAKQTCRDFGQTLLVDEIGRGISWSHENMAAYAPRLVGRYIWILDDDDLCTRDTLVAELKEIAQKQKPEMIIMRFDCGLRGIVPDAAGWGKPPRQGNISSSSFVLRRNVFQKWAHVLCPGVYHSDYILAETVYRNSQKIYWYDIIAGRIQQIGLGKPE